MTTNPHDDSPCFYWVFWRHKEKRLQFKNEAFVSFFLTLVTIKIRIETISQKILQVIFIP